MRRQRWWSVAIVGGSVIVGVILLSTTGEAWRVALGLSAIVVFVGSWFAFGWRCGPATAGTTVFVVITILFAGAVTLATPSAAIIQCVVFPLVWTRIERLAPTLVANVGIAVAVGAGLYISTGSWVQGVVIEALSLGFSIGLGLWVTQIATQSDERQRLLDELQATQQQLATLSRDAGVTSERERLAREIHDTIAQDLTGLVLLAQGAGRELAAGDTAAASERLALLEEGARTALAETRALVAASAPPALGEGIGAALERLGARFERETAIAVEVRTDVTEAVDRDLEVVLLRCAQEGLANVRKHSGASRAALALRWGHDRALQVSDNGAGFELGQKTDGYGLAGMRDRLALVGGTLDIESGEDGTTLLITLPKDSA